jgi:SSS family solute:Na+ symporter
MKILTEYRMLSVSKYILCFVLLCIVFYLGGCKAKTGGDETPKGVFKWSELTDIPEMNSFDGAFTGVQNNALVIAGGMYDSGSSTDNYRGNLHTGICVLENEKGRYILHKISQPEINLAYGVSIPMEKGLVCLGGRNEDGFSAEVFILEWDNLKKTIYKKMLPPLPKPCAYAGGAVMGSVIYITGGQSSSVSSPQKFFWAFDLSAQKDTENYKWQELPAWPGPARTNCRVAVQHDGFGEHLYIFGGQEGTANGGSQKVLNDAYRYSPAKKIWTEMASMPRDISSSACLPIGQSHILFFGQSDSNAGGMSNEPNAESSDVLAYHTITNTWAVLDKMPVRSMFTSATRWGDDIIVSAERHYQSGTGLALWRGVRLPVKREFGWINYLVLLGYLLSLVLIGIYFSRRETTTADFFVGGRRIPWWAAGISIYGAQLSAISYMATPAKCYSSNWIYFLGSKWVLFVAAPLVAFVFIPFFRRLNVTTAYEYLEKRFNTSVRLLASFVFVLCQVGRMGVVIFLPSLALSVVTGINLQFCILAMGVFCIIYTALGGMEAVIWADVLQVIVLLGGVIWCFFSIVGRLDDGFSTFFSIGFADAKFKLAYLDPPWAIDTPSLLVVFLAGVGSIIPYTSDQTVIQKYLTTKDEKAAGRSIWTNGLITVPASFLFFGLGTALYVFYKTHPALLHPDMSNDSVVPWTMMEQFPPGVSGMLVAGIFAAAMSTLDSSINSAATAIVNDFLRRFQSRVSDKKWLVIARWLTVLIGSFGTATAIIMSYCNIKSMVDMFTMIFGLLGGGLAGLFILGAFSRRAHGYGALLGAFGTAVILYYVQAYTSIHFFLYGAIGLSSCVILGLVFSILIPAAKPNIEGLTVYSLFKNRGKR